MKKRVCLLLAILGVVSGLAACGNGSDKRPEGSGNSEMACRYFDTEI